MLLRPNPDLATAFLFYVGKLYSIYRSLTGLIFLLEVRLSAWLWLSLAASLACSFNCLFLTESWLDPLVLVRSTISKI